MYAKSTVKTKFNAGPPPSSRTERLNVVPDAIAAFAQDNGFEQPSLRIEMRQRVYYVHESVETAGSDRNNPPRSFNIHEAIDGTDQAAPFHATLENTRDLLLLEARVARWKQMHTPMASTTTDAPAAPEA